MVKKVTSLWMKSSFGYQKEKATQQRKNRHTSKFSQESTKYISLFNHDNKSNNITFVPPYRYKRSKSKKNTIQFPIQLNESKAIQFLNSKLSELKENTKIKTKKRKRIKKIRNAKQVNKEMKLYKAINLYFHFDRNPKSIATTLNLNRSIIVNAIRRYKRNGRLMKHKTGPKKMIKSEVVEKMKECILNPDKPEQTSLHLQKKFYSQINTKTIPSLSTIRASLKSSGLVWRKYLKPKKTFTRK